MKKVAVLSLALAFGVATAVAVGQLAVPASTVQATYTLAPAGGAAWTAAHSGTSTVALNPGEDPPPPPYRLPFFSSHGPPGGRPRCRPCRWRKF